MDSRSLLERRISGLPGPKNIRKAKFGKPFQKGQMSTCNRAHKYSNVKHILLCDIGPNEMQPNFLNVITQS